MGYPVYRFTLINDVSGTLVVDEVDGWQDIELVLERDQEFHSIIELVETPLDFYGAAKDYIVNVIDTQGLDSTVQITIDLSADGGTTYTEIFDGVLSLENAREVYESDQSFRLDVPILPVEFWQKFKNRFKTPVRIGDTTDLDGGTRETITSHTLNLLPQVIVQSYEANVESSNPSFSLGLNDYCVFEYPDVIRDEIETTFNLGTGSSSTLPAWKIAFKYAADVVFDDVFIISASASASSLNYVIQINDDTPISYTETVLASGPSGTILSYDLSTTFSVSEGDTLRIYGQVTSGSGGVYTLASFTDLTSPRTYSEISIVINSTKPTTTSEGYRIHEVGNSIADLITGQDGAFYSEYLGNTSSQIQTYSSDGGGSYYWLSGGLNIRGKTLTEKGMFMSFDKWWNGANPIFNLGLGYEDISGTTVIRVEEKEHFYDDTPHTQLTYIENLERTFDDNLFIKAVEIGYKKWKAEEKGVIDDPQSKHTYATRYKTFGTDVKLLSEFYAAGIGIEQTRRKSILEVEDWKLDDEIMIITLNRGLGSPIGLDYPERDEEFGSVTNVTNSETRYNLRITPKRALLRHMNWLSAGLTKYAGSEYKFTSAEGNYDMTSDLNDVDRGDYDNISIGESEDVAWDYGSPLEVEQRPLFVPEIYEFDYDLTFTEFQAFKTNRKQSFEISETNTNVFSVFPLRISYNPSKGRARFKVIKAY